MEFKRIPFERIQKRYDLTDRQMYYILDRFKKYHQEDHWLKLFMNAVGYEELWIYFEGLEWIEEVYLKFDVPYVDAELNFLNKQIIRLENELNIHEDPIQSKTMNVYEVADYFGKSIKTIYGIIKCHKEIDKWIISHKPIIIHEQGVRWVELNVYRRRYMKDLYTYKRKLQSIKREIAKEKLEAKMKEKNEKNI